MEFKSRITILTGNFGSGKTEIAINLARKLNAEGKRIALVDLDIVNPYFRSREMREELEKEGIHVIAPRGALAQADLPAIPPEIMGALEDESYHVIMDVGGDDLGAVALGRFHGYLSTHSYEMYMVVNAFRPFTRDEDGFFEMLQGIEQSSRLKIDALISNPNLGAETQKDHIIQGHQKVLTMARQNQLDIKFLAVEEGLTQEIIEFYKDIPIFPIKLYMLPPWR